MSGGPPSSRYAFEDELNLASPPHDPFSIPDEDYDSDEYDNTHPDTDAHEWRRHSQQQYKQKRSTSQPCRVVER
eukprot:scaffold15755_cov97-Skeletonema_dohrnii-CCMP3373.AAC.3